MAKIAIPFMSFLSTQLQIHIYIHIYIIIVKDTFYLITPLLLKKPYCIYH